jgi:mRNA interferase MazF
VTLGWGDLVVAAAPGYYGKPRPSLVVQSNRFLPFPSVTLCLLTSEIRQDWTLLRILVEPTEDNGLRSPSQVMIDKIFTLPADKISQRIGRLTLAQMGQVNLSLSAFLGLSDGLAARL